MNKNFKYTIIAILLISTIGCSKSKLINVYSEDEIASMKIEEIIDNEDLTSKEKTDLLQIKIAEKMAAKKKSVDIEKDTKLASIISKPVAPMRTSPTILRILLLPYENSEGVLNSWRYSFLKVDDGDWILSDHLNAKTIGGNKILTPLDINKSEVINRD